MAQDRTVHTKRIDANHCRDLNVYYQKPSTNFWSNEVMPRGIYFSASKYEYVEGGAFKTWSTGQKGDGSFLVTQLERYKPTALKAVRQRVSDNAELLHALIEDEDYQSLRAIVMGTASDVLIRGLEHAYAPILDQAADAA